MIRWSHNVADDGGMATYQPASRQWPFQPYETAVFVAPALALAAVSVWWVRRRLT
jgi:hypothetical protein